VERVPISEFDPSESDQGYWIRNGEPFTGVVFSTFEGRLAGEWVCKGGVQWGPERQYDEEGLLREAQYYIAGHIHGIRRQWGLLGEKYVLGEFRFGVELRGRWWRPGGPVVTDDRTVGPEAEATAQYLSAYREDVTNAGGDPSEVPAPYLTLMPGEWDDPPAPGDADRWLALFPPDQR
jgi:hypothetical protein